MRVTQKNRKIFLEGGYTPATFSLVPDQRKKGKKQVAVWLTKEERAALDALSKKTGKTKTAILKEKIDEYLRTLEK